jgi:hypothetical protein
MGIRYTRKLLVLLAVALAPANALAGMSMPTLTDIAQARLEVISFFGVGYLVLAFIYQKLWNSLARDFQKLPRLTYRGALGALVVCGLFIYVVLTMISGARELMTPGAWERSGVMYHLREPEKDPKPWLDAARGASLEKARTALWKYAEKHGGVFPLRREDSEIPATTWQSIDPGGLELVYVPGQKADSGKNVVVYEPDSFGVQRFVLLADGEIVEWQIEDLKKQINAQIKALDVTGINSGKP